jgi:hypothetical protein
VSPIHKERIGCGSDDFSPEREARVKELSELTQVLSQIPSPNAHSASQMNLSQFANRVKANLIDVRDEQATGFCIALGCKALAEALIEQAHINAQTIKKFAETMMTE